AVEGAGNRSGLACEDLEAGPHLWFKADNQAQSTVGKEDRAGSCELGVFASRCRAVQTKTQRRRREEADRAVDSQNAGAVGRTRSDDAAEGGDGIERAFTAQKPISDGDGASNGHWSGRTGENTARDLQAAGESLQSRPGQVGASGDRR